MGGVGPQPLLHEGGERGRADPVESQRASRAQPVLPFHSLCARHTPAPPRPPRPPSAAPPLQPPPTPSPVEAGRNRHPPTGGVGETSPEGGRGGRQPLRRGVQGGRSLRPAGVTGAEPLAGGAGVLTPAQQRQANNTDDETHRDTPSGRDEPKRRTRRPTETTRAAETSRKGGRGDRQRHPERQRQARNGGRGDPQSHPSGRDEPKKRTRTPSETPRATETSRNEDEDSLQPPERQRRAETEDEDTLRGGPVTPRWSVNQGPDVKVRREGPCQGQTPPLKCPRTSPSRIGEANDAPLLLVFSMWLGVFSVLNWGFSILFKQRDRPSAGHRENGLPSPMGNGSSRSLPSPVSSAWTSWGSENQRSASKPALTQISGMGGLCRR